MATTNYASDPDCEKPPIAVLGPPPPYVEDNPSVWVIQLDLYFARAQVKREDTKFQTAMSLLPACHVMEFIDMVRDPPADCYTKLCDALQSRLGKSTEEKLKILLAAQELGDRKPSQFLRHLQELTKPHITDKDSPLIRQIFLKAMPDSALPFLEFLPTDTSLLTLAGTADRVVAALPQASAAVNAVTSCNSPSSTSDCSLTVSNAERLDKIIEKLDKVCKQLDTLSKQTRSNSRPGRRDSRSREKSEDRRGKLCWYQKRFGKEANSCVQPCNYEKSLNYLRSSEQRQA